MRIYTYIRDRPPGSYVPQPLWKLSSTTPVEPPLTPEEDNNIVFMTETQYAVPMLSLCCPCYCSMLSFLLFYAVLMLSLLSLVPHPLWKWPL